MYTKDVEKIIIEIPCECGGLMDYSPTLPHGDMIKNHQCLMYVCRKCAKITWACEYEKKIVLKKSLPEQE